MFGEGFRFFGDRGFSFRFDDEEIPERFRFFLDDLGEIPLDEYFEDGELSDEERRQLREYFEDFRGRLGFEVPDETAEDAEASA